jgi:hypothetical protein
VGARFQDEIEPGPNGPQTTGTFNAAWTPVGGASIRYHWQHRVSVTLAYAHRYRAVLESLVNTVSQVDEVALGSFFIFEPLRFDAGAAFRFQRYDSRRADTPDQSDEGGSRHWRGWGTVTFVVLPWLSIDATYDVEAVLDPVAYRNTPGGSVELTALEDYVRHRLLGGISLVWPPPPPQDQRLNTRVSSYQPVFTATAGAAEEQYREAGLVNPDRVEGQQNPNNDPDSPEFRDPDREDASRRQPY